MLNDNCQYNIIFSANFLDKFGFTINYNEKILPWIDHKISLKNLNECFLNNMFIDLYNQLCQHKEDMFKQEVLENYVT